MAEEMLKKLKALMEKGIGGEAENAKRILESLLKKEGKTLEDYLNNSDIQKKRYWFSYSNTYQKKLLGQILFYVLDCSSIMETTNKNKRNQVAYDITATENIEILTIYETLKTKLMEEIDITVEAFVYRHRLFSNSECAEDKTLSERDKRILERIKTIQKNPIHKQITYGENK